MKKFKHKKIGWVAELVKDNDFYYADKRFVLPIELIENSEDWEEIKEFILTTEDGVELFDRDFLYAVYTDFSIGKSFVNSKAVDYRNSSTKYFAKKENAEEYVLMNQKLLSLKDLLNSWGLKEDEQCFINSPLFKSFKQKAIKNKEV
jgi:hypothetical protein